MKKTTKERLEQKALELFSRKGYEGTSMAMIARAVGIQKASLYAHYAGKEAIFRKIFADLMDGYAQCLGSLVADQGGQAIRDAMLGVFTGYINYFSDDVKMNFWNRVYLSPPAFIKKEVFELSFQIEFKFIMGISSMLKDAARRHEIRKVNLEDAAMLFYYAILGFAIAGIYYKEGKIMDKAARTVDLIFEGLRP